MLKWEKIIKKWSTNQILKLGTKKIWNFTKIIKKSGIRNAKKKKKSCERLNFLQQVKQGPYYICTICHGSLSQGVVWFFKDEKYQIVTLELYDPVKLEGKWCHEHLYKNEIPSQAVCNKMALDPIPNEL